MKIIKVTQGTAEWAALRARHNTASEAPVMMGVSKYQTRDELLRQKLTGLVPEVTPRQQAIFDRGHAAEAAARELLEVDTGDEFYPVTAVSDDGTLLASMDGITLDDTTLFEHKLWNEKLAARVRMSDLEPHYYWQLEQQLLVSDAERVIFVCSDGTRENWVQMEYLPVTGRAAQLVAGWAQFEIDKAVFVPTAAAPVVVATAVAALPAVIVTVSGGIQVSNNLALFQTALMDFIENRLILNPSTDQDFADQDVQIKAMLAAEAALDAVEVSMLAQVSEVDSVLKLKQMLVKLVRDNRLKAQKQLATRKEEIKQEIVAGGINAFTDHIAALNVRIGKRYMPIIPSDFAGAIKSKRTIASLHDAVNTELARVKIEASAVADRIQVNMATLGDLAVDYVFLFSDAAQIVLKAPDDLTLLVKARIADHQTALAKTEEATRLRIRAEEQAKAEREAREKVLAEQAAERAEAQRMSAIQAQAEKVAADFAAQQNAPQIIQEIIPAHTAGGQDEFDNWRQGGAYVPANVVPMRASAPMVATILGTPPTLKLGQIGERLGFGLTGEFLKNLGFEPAARDKSALLFHESQFPLICMRLVAHIQMMQTRAAA